MSMLAERRTKVRWILNPRSNQWSDDSTKFGQRLMEKMGWKSGNGLGANQQGSTAAIKVAVRNDNRGIGFKGRPEDVLPHQDNFTELLQQLSEATPAASPAPTQTSLEEKSQQSKARVHYHKFTRGKDLSRYSQKDLTCILGKSVPRAAPLNTSAGPPVTLESDVVTIDRGNMVDYFKSKKPLFKTAFKHSSDDEAEEKASFGFGFQQRTDVADKSNFGFGFQENMDLKQEPNLSADNETVELLKEEKDTIVSPTVKRKKSKKRLVESDKVADEDKLNLNADNETSELCKEENDTADAPTVKRKKSKKRLAESETDNTLDEEKTKKSKAKRAKLDTSTVTEESNDHVISNNDEHVKKKKRKKHSSKDEVVADKSDIQEELSEKKKRKKEKNTDEEEEKQSKKERKEAERLRKQVARRKSVTFSEELFEVMLIPPRDEVDEPAQDDAGEPAEDDASEPAEDDAGEPAEDDASEPAEDDAGERVQDEGIHVEVVNGNRYINGIWEHSDIVNLYRYKAEHKTDAYRAIPRETRKDVIIGEFLGANIHALGGYAGLRHTQSRF